MLIFNILGAPKCPTPACRISGINPVGFAGLVVGLHGLACSRWGFGVRSSNLKSWELSLSLFWAGATWRLQRALKQLQNLW